jgi:hypothetical protein
MECFIAFSFAPFHRSTSLPKHGQLFCTDINLALEGAVVQVWTKMIV